MSLKNKKGFTRINTHEMVELNRNGDSGSENEILDLTAVDEREPLGSCCSRCAISLSLSQGNYLPKGMRGGSERLGERKVGAVDIFKMCTGCHGVGCVFTYALHSLSKDSLPVTIKGETSKH